MQIESFRDAQFNVHRPQAANFVAAPIENARADFDIHGDSATQLPPTLDLEQDDERLPAVNFVAAPIGTVHGAVTHVHIGPLQVNDFNGRQVHVPLEHCTSWKDLCSYLVSQLGDQDGGQFVTSGSFGLLAPNESELLSNNTWDAWLGNYSNGDLQPGILELYAIITDDSDRCPKCFKPVTHRLPDSLQRCAFVECQFTFLVVYREAGVNWGPLPDIRHAANLPPGKIPDQHDPPGEIGYSPSTSSSAMSSALPVPAKVQVIRRKPYRADPVDEPLISQSIEEVTLPASEPKTPETSFEFLIIPYIFLFLGLPDRYFREALHLQALGDDGAGRNPFQRWIGEWTYLGCIALAISGLLVAIPSSGNDPIVHTLALLSVVCLCAGAGYAATLVMTFGRLETVAERRVWIRQAMRAMPQNSFWNPWIMLAMPLAWIGWGVFYGVVLIGAFIWRDGATNEPDENSRLLTQAYGPKVVEMSIYVVSLGYFGLMVRTVRGIGFARTI
ncbi:hypothetical protein C8J57DRAFT_110868 [Mycena rebaudengoi]|nr:hypothetical protein C8J57DRAFT_110868 [Mycena rebaudengoi]